MKCRKTLTRRATLLERTLLFEAGCETEARDGGPLLLREECGSRLDDDGRCPRCGGVAGRRDRPAVEAKT